VRSASDTLGSREYVRLRFGVGRPATEAVETLIARGLDRAQTALHGAVTGDGAVASRSER
jgi:hypothetical protein